MVQTAMTAWREVFRELPEETQTHLLELAMRTGNCRRVEALQWLDRVIEEITEANLERVDQGEPEYTIDDMPRLIEASLNVGAWLTRRQGRHL